MAALRATPNLRGRSFRALVVTQFLGAFNDNAYKMIVLLVVSAGMVASKGGAKYTAGATAAFAVAYICFSALAGYLADRFSKRNVIVLAKLAEVVVMGLAFFALLAGDRVTPIVVLFLMAVQSAFFSPAKYGILPELLDEGELPQGNGIVNMTTYIAIILGTVVGAEVMHAVGRLDPASGRYRGPVQYAAFVFVAIAALGTVSAFLIGRVSPGGPRRKPRKNFLADSWAGIRRVRQDRPLLLAMLADVYAWVFGAVFFQNFVPYAWEVLRVTEARTTGYLTGALCIGIGAGSLLAGRLSGRKIEFGMVPLGAVGIALCSFAYCFTAMPEHLGTRLWLTGVNQLMLGISVGFYVVPLSAFIQHRGPKNAKGDTIATLNFITFVGILLGAGGVYVLSAFLKLNPAHIFAAAGVFTLGVIVWICRVIPDVLLRFVLWLAAQTVYRFRVVGSDRVPKEGPALLVCNHVSLVDFALVSAVLSRPVRFVMYRAYYEHPLIHWAAKRLRAIPVAPKDGPRALLEALAEARRALVEEGALVCIFAEGSVTRTGNLLGFRSGFERIVRGTGVPVIPVHLDRVWGSVFSHEGGRVLWKWPRSIPYPVTVSFGAPMPDTAKAHAVRTAVAELGAEAFDYRRGAQVLLHHAFIRGARAMWRKPCVADSSGWTFRYGGLLIASALLSRRIRLLADGDENVGLLLPPSAGGVVANIATLFAGKAPVNLNYTTSAESIRAAMEDAGIRRVLTSRRFVEQAGLTPMPEMVMLEDVLADVTRWEKVRTALGLFALPKALVYRKYSRRGLRPDDPATILFSSGTTGRPKGVVLSHKNVAANIDGFCEVFSFDRDDCMCGVLPFFHAFGFTATLWAPVLRHFRVVYHPNPLDGKTIGRLVREHRATHLIATPTFLMMYVRQCRPADFLSLRMVVAGAEKLQRRVADAFEQRFNVRPLEGYGCTELSPVAAANIPDVRRPSGEVQVGTKEGTIGQTLPNVVAKVIDVDTGEPLPPDREGLLLIKGPNVMLGYLNDPRRTAEVIRDGWYVTGDIARIDEDGFITITDRLSRFSKLGGEMVPHVAVEDAIQSALGATGRVCVVTSVPDERKGERLAVLHTPLPISVDELWERLNQTDLPKLWIPKKEMFRQIDEIPLLGSGKTALGKVKKMAEEIWGGGD